MDRICPLQKAQYLGAKVEANMVTTAIVPSIKKQLIWWNKFGYRSNLIALQ